MTFWLRTRSTFLAILFLGIFAMAVRNSVDPDLWWHLKTGQLIVEHHAVPHTDPFSFTRAGQPWVAHEWLSEVLMYELLQIAGWPALILFFAAAICATFVLLFFRCGHNAYIAGVAVLLAALATRPLWGVRPQMLSLLLTSLWLVILERSESNPRLLWWTLPLTLLWVNLHAGFALGIGLSILFLSGEWIARFSGRAADMTRLRGLALNLALDISLVWLNPNGIKLYWYPIVTLRSQAMQTYIAEWASPNFHHPEYWPFLIILLGLLALILWSRHNIRARDLLLLIASLAAALRSTRLIPIFVLIAIPIAARQIDACFQRRQAIERRHSVRIPAIMRHALNPFIAFAFLIFVAVQTIAVIRKQPQAEALSFPLRAISFLQANPIPGHLFNHYDWGGYLIWKLYPSTHVFIDGRADVYGDEFFHDFADTYQLRHRWRQNLDRWRIARVLLPANSPLATGLHEDPDWSVLYSDGQAIVLIRKNLSPTGFSVSTSALPPR